MQAKSTHHVASKTLVKIEVRDTNDNRPQFVHTEIEGQTSENSIVGTRIIKLTAVDRDEGNNSVLAFEILNTDVPFLITDEGEIQVKSSLDRETTDFYNLTIRVYEKFSVEQYSNTTHVLLEIIDANDNTPLFTNDNFTIEVSENRPVSNQSLFTFTAVDQDIGENGGVEFILDTPNTPFTLNKSSGVLTLTGELDYETSPAYNLQVSVHDSPLNEGEQRRTSTVLRVNVLNTNDNPPVFQQSIYTSSILEVVHNRTTVLNVLAIDADNDDIEYTITDGDHGKFSIDQTSAEIFTVDYLDRETQDVYNLTVRASDGVHRTHCHVLIQILDGNDNWPIFNETDGQYFFSVLESVNDSFVGKVQATDIDLEMAGHVTYSLPGNTMFAIGKESGIIRNIVPLDRETTNLHTFTVVARDSANDYRSSFAQVTVKVLDTNDNAPFFTSLTPSELLINAHTPNRTLLTVFNAQDADDTANSISVYTAKNLPDFLELNNQTGELHLTSIPKTFFAAKFQVTATNVQPPFHNATIEIEAKITSLENYDTPEFSKGAYELSVQENLSIGAVVYDFNATYKGQPESPPFVYKLVAMDTHQYFHLEEDGRLTTLKILDREEIDDYKLTISVSLRDSSALNFASVVIHVLDVNDNRPYFVSGNVTKYIREISDIGTVVTQVQAADSDEKPVFFFKMIDSSECFSIEENTGVIRVHSNLKTLSVTEIPLIITINDGFENWQGSIVKVVVKLLTNETIGEVVTLHQGSYVSENKQDLVYLLGNLTDSEVFIDRISSESPTGYLVQFYSVKNGVLQNKDGFKSAFKTVESDVMREWIEKWKLYLISIPPTPGATSAIDHKERYLLIGIIISLAFLLICALILALFVRIKANKRQQRLLTPTYLRGSPTKERYNKDLYNSIRVDEAGPFYTHDTLSMVPGASRTELPTPDGTLTASTYTKMETLRSHQPHQRLAIPEYPPTTAEDEGNLANGQPSTDFVYTGENRDVAGNGDANLTPADDANQMSSYIKNLENFDFYPDKTDNRAADGGEAVEGPEVDGRGMVYVSPMSKSPTDSRSEADDTIKTFCVANNADENNDVNNKNNEQETLGASNIAFAEEDARSTVIVRGQMSTTL